MKELEYWKTKFEFYFLNIKIHDKCHDVTHFQRVWKTAQEIIGNDDSIDKLVVMTSCYFHDLVNYPKDHPKRSQSSIESSTKTRAELAFLGFPNDKIDQVCHCIETHSFSANIVPESIEAKILHDSDRMEALGAIGIARTFYIAGMLGSKLFSEDDPFAKKRKLDDKSFALDHFYLKLLKLSKSMRTKNGRLKADSKTLVIKQFLNDFKSELQ